VGAGFVTDAELGPVCNNIPDIPELRIFRVGPGNPIYEAVAFFRNAAENIWGILKPGAGEKNFAVARYAFEGVERFLWAVSGDNFDEVLELEDKLRELGQQVAGVVRGILTPTVAGGRLRDTDTEIKILEQILVDLPQDIAYGTRIVIDLYTERIPCLSCGGTSGIGGVIDEFARLAWTELGLEVVVNVAYGFGARTLPQGISIMP
jgi:hypothetical protein